MKISSFAAPEDDMLTTYIQWRKYLYNKMITCPCPCRAILMMTSSNVNIFRVTGHLYAEFTGNRSMSTVNRNFCEDGASQLHKFGILDKFSLSCR